MVKKLLIGGLKCFIDLTEKKLQGTESRSYPILVMFYKVANNLFP